VVDNQVALLTLLDFASFRFGESFRLNVYLVHDALIVDLFEKGIQGPHVHVSNILQTDFKTL